MMKYNLYSLRLVGFLVVAVAVVMAFTLVSFIDTLVEANHASCTCGDICGMKDYETPYIVYAGVVGVSLMFLIGVMLFARGGSFREQSRSSGWDEKLKTLNGDERDVYKLMVDSGGTLFQSEIVESSGLSKVKVTRTLDKLESLRLLDRRRRGLTNIIVLRE